MNVLLHPVTLMVIGIVSVARMTRFVTYDDFPPMEWLRGRLVQVLPNRWGAVMVCPFCMAPYLMAVQIAWFLATYHAPQSTFLIWWVLPHGWWAASYLSSIVVAHDQPE